MHTGDRRKTAKVAARVRYHERHTLAQRVSACAVGSSVGASAMGTSLFEQEVLSDHGSYTTGATELRGHDGEVKQGEQQVPQVTSG